MTAGAGARGGGGPRREGRRMRIKVLLVDDEKDFVEMLSERLTARGLSVRTALSGEEAMERIKEESPDVVLLDVQMSGKDGIEVLRDIKHGRPLIEVIMLTGHASLESGLEGMKIGAFDYIMKPTSIDDLVEKINQAYEKKIAHEGKIKNALEEDLIE